jgi:hypothetical protein
MSGSTATTDPAAGWTPPPEFQGYEVVPVGPQAGQSQPGTGAVAPPAPAPQQQQQGPRDTSAPPSWAIPGYDVVRLPDYGGAAPAGPYQGPGASGSYVANFAAGAADALMGLATAPASIVQGMSNTLRRGWNAATGQAVPTDATDYSAKLRGAVESATGYDPSQVPSPDIYHQMARGAGAGAATMAALPMGGGAEGVTVLGALGRGALNAVGRTPAGALYGAEGEAAKAGAEGLVPEDVPGWVKPTVGAVASVAGPMALNAAPGLIGRVGGSLARSALVPNDAGTQELLNIARQNGAEIGAGDVTTSRFARNLNSKLRSFPFSGYSNSDEGLQNAFLGDLNSRMGLTEQHVAQAPQIDPNITTPIPMDRVTSQHISLADTVNGGGMGQIVNSNAMRLDGALGQDFRSVLDNFGSPGVGLPTQVAEVRNRVADIVSTLQTAATRAGTPNQVPGTLYQTMTQFGAPLVDAISGAPNGFLERANAQIKQALDDAWHRSLPEDQWQAYQQFRSNYANTRIIEPMTRMADDPLHGHYPSVGILNPDQLRGALNRKLGPEGTAYLNAGGSQLDDLARLMQRIREARTSGTSEGLNATKFWSVEGLMHSLGGAIGGQTMGRAFRASALPPPGDAWSDMAARIARGNPGRFGAAAAGGAVNPSELVVTPGGASWQPQQPPEAPQGTAGPTVNPADQAPQFDLADAQTVAAGQAGQAAGSLLGSLGTGAGPSPAQVMKGLQAVTGQSGMGDTAGALGQIASGMLGRGGGGRGSRGQGQGGQMQAAQSPYSASGWVPGPAGAAGGPMGPESAAPPPGLAGAGQATPPHSSTLTLRPGRFFQMSPVTNPSTGLASFNLRDAQAEQHAEAGRPDLVDTVRRIVANGLRHTDAEHVARRGLARDFLRHADDHTAWVRENTARIKREGGRGQAVQHLAQLGAALKRRDADGRGATNLHHVAETLADDGDRGARHALHEAGVTDVEGVIAHAIGRPDIMGLLVKNRTGGHAAARKLAKMVETGVAGA